MEACGCAHYWARQIQTLGIEVRLLPARYIRAYVKRNKTDAADAAALLEAARCADIQSVRIKSVEQQALQSLHRTRSLWMSTRTCRINALRGFCREFGIDIAQGARVGLEQIARALADPNSLLPHRRNHPVSIPVRRRGLQFWFITRPIADSDWQTTQNKCRSGHGPPANRVTPA
jgi:transposase